MMAINKEKFQSFEDIRVSGVINMFDTRMVASESDGLLSKRDVLEVIKLYEFLTKLYPDVVEKGEVNDG